jgi:hypothetical protein
VIRSARHRAERFEGKRTLSLDIADFWSLILKKAAPRRCLSESLRSLKDMVGGGGGLVLMWVEGVAALLGAC